MGQAISEVLPFAVGIAISPIPIIAVILMLFSARARVNSPGVPARLGGGARGRECCRVRARRRRGRRYELRASDAVSWSKILLGILLLLAAAELAAQAGPGGHPEMPKWMGGIDGLSPGKALGLGVLLSSVNPKNLALAIGASAGLAQLGVSTTDAGVALIVFVVVASITIAGPVVYYLFGGDGAREPTSTSSRTGSRTTTPP